MTTYDHCHFLPNIPHKQSSLYAPDLAVVLDGPKGIVPEDLMRSAGGTTLNQQGQFQSNSFIGHVQQHAIVRLVIAQDMAAFVRDRDAILLNEGKTTCSFTQVQRKSKWQFD